MLGFLVTVQIKQKIKSMMYIGTVNRDGQFITFCCEINYMTSSSTMKSGLAGQNII